MDLQAARKQDAGTWRFARIGFYFCFGLTGLLLLTSLWMPAKVRAEAGNRPAVQLILSSALPSSG